MIALIPVLLKGNAEPPAEDINRRNGEKNPVSFYCDFAPGHEWHGPYHETEYGFPLRDDHELFGRLILEINQAGLSWLTILKKREAFERAYHAFDIDRVARYEIGRAHV